MATKRYAIPGMLLVVHEDEEGNKTYERISTKDWTFEDFKRSKEEYAKILMGESKVEKG